MVQAARPPFSSLDVVQRLLRRQQCTLRNFHHIDDLDLYPEPVLYRLETEINGQKWSLSAVVRMLGNPRRKTSQLPKHDAETIKEILESHYGEK